MYNDQIAPGCASAMNQSLAANVPGVTSDSVRCFATGLRGAPLLETRIEFARAGNCIFDSQYRIVIFYFCNRTKYNNFVLVGTSASLTNGIHRSR